MAQNKVSLKLNYKLKYSSYLYKILTDNQKLEQNLSWQEEMQVKTTSRLCEGQKVLDNHTLLVHTQVVFYSQVLSSHLDSLHTYTTFL